MSKQAIREEYKALREAMRPEQLDQQSKSICTSVMKLIGEVGCKNIHLFLPINKHKEVNIWPLYHAYIISPNHTLVISKTHWESKSLTHHPMAPGDEVEESKLGIPEPTHDRLFDIAQLDLVLVPLLAFDLKGNRLGYGAGFYDRFLSECGPKTLKVGLSLFQPTDHTLPSDARDIALDLCITPEKTYDFRS